MSLVNLECPICEFVFEANPHEANPHEANLHQANLHQGNLHQANLQGAGQVRCTCCGHVFAPGKSTINPLQSPVTPPATPDQQNESSTTADSQPIVGRADQLRSSIILQRASARRRDNLILLLLFIGTLAAGALVAKRFYAMEQYRQQHVADSNFSAAALETPLHSTVTPAVPEANEAVTPDPPIDATQLASEEKPSNTAATVKLDPPEFLFLSATVAADQAASFKPYVMLLEIESPNGRTYATGTVVDSRGYLLTSLPAVAGATNITVSPAQSRSQMKNEATPPLSDTIGSVVAVSHRQQWALLEINRRLVINAADVPIPEVDRIVARLPLLRVVAPRSLNDYAASEMQVDRRQKSSALTAKQRKLLNVSGDEEENWIVGRRSPFDQLGAALVSTDGELVAVLVNFDQTSSYFIHASAIGKLLKENNLSKQPLSSLK